ncbi:MAG TPA: hypothetical protein VH394_11870 [Thermoanaerobaculia bacterium]|jgi:hypothetical protein|nr:hypothetical protein [Thermoanaerobaculia bacterium]
MARRRSKLDTEIQGLYGLPLSEFTAARNALAKRLKKEGEKDGAEEVTSLPKPTVSAWAVNHLFTVESDRMEELLAAGERARKALRQILSGGDPGALRDAIQEARDLANDLRDRAVEALSESGNRPGAAIVERIATNLQSLAFSPVAEPVLERGWLDVDLPPVGFEVLAGLQLAALPAKPKPKPQPVPERKAEREKEDKEEARLREKREREEAKARERREKEEEKSRERADREEARRRERVARLRAQKEEAAGRADFLRRKAEQAEKVAEEARQKAEEAERLAADARKRADEADRELAKAEKAVEAARR